MMATGFLGFLTIAQNDSNSSIKQKYRKANKFINPSYIIRKRSFSTSSRVNSTTNSKGLSQVQVFILEKNLKPVYVYEDLEQESTIKVILQ
jgi:hypothetical protein